MARILDGKAVAAEVRARVATEVAGLVARRADVLVVAAGRREMVGAEHVKEGAAVVDVGIHRTEAGSLVGDVRFDEVEPRVAWISPVPGGVGPMTRAMLLHNALKSASEAALR